MAHRIPQEFKVGTRVRVNSTMQYPAFHGRVGTVVRVPSKGPPVEWIEVRFDDNPNHTVQWHFESFDIADEQAEDRK